LNILWINQRDPQNPESGGAEIRLSEIGRRLVKKGYHVTLLCERWQGSEKKDVIDGIEVFRVGGRYSLHLMVPEVLRKMEKKHDIVVDDVANGVPWFSPFFTKKPVIGQVHHVHQEVAKIELPWYSKWGVVLSERAVKNLYDTVVAVSESTKQNLIEEIGVSRKKVNVILNGIDHAAYFPSNKSLDPLILYVGRIKRYKRVEHVILAFREVKKRLPDARLIIVGNGDRLEYLKKFVTKLAVPSIEFLGRVDETEKVRLMGQSWLMVGCSIVEGWGMTVIEGAACGTPFVAYDVPGFRDSIINAETGILVGNGQIGALASGMLKVLENKDFRMDLSKNALAYSARFSWDTAADEFEKVLNWTINGR
jgi:glycosyltransferase involved in cell wall biosynthesis